MKDINAGVVYSNKLITHSLGSIIDMIDDMKVLYPMEGRNWEKTFVQKINSKHGKAIGYLHAALTPRQLSLTKHSFYKPQEMPSAIIAPSIFSLKLMKQNFPNVMVKKGFFLRGKVGEGKLNKIDDKLLLFALTGNLQEATYIMKAIASIKGLDGWRVVVKLNSNTSTYKVLADLANELNLELLSRTDEKLPSICFYRSSSVAIDYLKLGVMPVFLKLNEIFTNNIFELDDKCRFVSVSVDENFNASVNSIIEMKPPPSVNDGFNASQ